MNNFKRLRTIKALHARKNAWKKSVSYHKVNMIAEEAFYAGMRRIILSLPSSQNP